MMTTRERRTLQRYFTRRIVPMGPGVWIVTAKKRQGKPQLPYTVSEDDDGQLQCTCPKFVEQTDCEHTGAVLKYVTDGLPKSGYNVREDSRPTYPTDNVRIRAAHRVMQRALPHVVRALARHLYPITGKRKRGRPATEMCDLIYGIALRAIHGIGGAAAQALVHDAFDRRLMYHRPIVNAQPPSEDAITNGMRKAATRDAFEELIARSNDPFKGKPDSIALDGSEFQIPRRSAPRDEPPTEAENANLRGFADEEHDRILSLLRVRTVKLCAAVSTTDRMFAAAIVGPGKIGESTVAVELIERSRKVRDVNLVLGDKAYLSGEILAHLYNNGIAASIPVKSNSSEESKNPIFARHVTAWKQRNDEQRSVYGRRQLVESSFSRLKRVFGHALRSITFEAQQTELLCLVLLMNCRTLIESYIAGEIAPESMPWLDGHCRKLLDPARDAVEGHPRADRTPRFHDNLDSYIEEQRLDEPA